MTTGILGLCPCGSGLRALRCCALDLATVPPHGADRHLLPLVERAAKAGQQGAADTMERLCLEVLELSPGQQESLWMLSRRRAAQGQPGAAETLVRRIVALNPASGPALQDLALRLLQRGALEEAERHARSALRLAPADAQSHNLMGMILTEARQPGAGEFHYRRVLDLTGRRDPILLANLAWCLKLQSRGAEARALYEESHAAAPGVFQTLLGWARLELADGSPAQALVLAAQAEQAAPGQPGTALLRAAALRQSGDLVAARAALDSAGHAQSPEVLAERARLLDLAGEHDAAFDAFAAAARLGPPPQAGLTERAAAELRGFFTPERLRVLPRAGVGRDGPQPVFLLGGPGSGLAWVEQLLATHPEVAPCGELPGLARIVAAAGRLLNSALPYPGALAELWMGDGRDGLDDLRDRYLRQAAAPGGAALFIDRAPVNLLHAGLIGLMFPAAPLIHVLRHPHEAVLAEFLAGGGGLEALARQFAATAALGEHYRTHMALRYLPVRYEDIVADPPGQVRRLLAFAGLDPAEPGALPPAPSHAARRHDYQAPLAAVAPVLQPFLDRLGYGPD